VLTGLLNWLDHRTGYRKFLSVMLIEHIPGGARWRYVWGSCLLFVFLLQLITGVLLMTAYSAGDSTAWGSVYYIQYEMDFGWFIRGLHHFGSQTMVILLALHMLQVVIAGAHLPPREVNWWLGLILLGLVLALSLTGYLLPWDQKGFWATQVATNIAGNMPGIGSWLQKIIVGGPAYGHNTLTRFYALHVAILPPLVILFVILHMVVFRRHGVTTPKDAEGEGWFWPDQAFRDLIVCLLIFGVMLGLVIYGQGNPIEGWKEKAAESSLYDRWAHAGRAGAGANLDAPADPGSDYPARPEWYFLFLFQLLKYFEGDQEILGTLIIPNAVMLLLAVLPLLGIGRMRTFGHVIGVLVVTWLLTGVIALTCVAIAEDMLEPVPREAVRLIGLRLIPITALFMLFWLGILSLLHRGTFRSALSIAGTLVLVVLVGGTGYLFLTALKDEQAAAKRDRSGEKEQAKGIPGPITQYIESQMTEEQKKPGEKAQDFHAKLTRAETLASRAVNLAQRGIPAAGAGQLLRRDPLTQGPDLFRQNCASCHAYGGEFHKPDKKGKVASPPTASNLKGFGTEEWIFRLVTNPGGPDNFGHTPLTGMKDFIETTYPNLLKTPEEQARLPKEDRDLLEGDKKNLRAIARWLASHPRNSSPDKNQDWFKKGKALFLENCKECHRYESEGARRGPEMTGYGDADWLRLMIMAPYDRSRYGKNNTMPAFRDLQGPTGELTRIEIENSRQAMLAKVKGTSRRDKEEIEQINKAHDKVMQLSDVQRELIIRWLLGKNDVVFGGEPIGSAPPREK
jgi:quinol-cytochrome oxidoreductase complex cytochrome b subunit/mono/diheme cytochrome c family protein